MRYFRIVLYALFFFIFAGNALPAEPLVTRISPDLRVYPQYFSVEQDNDRNIYIGGTDGILRFDGGRWTWLKTPKPGAVRALHSDSKGRLWVGGSDCFGYVETTRMGALKYVDLSPQFQTDLSNAKFADIWQITEYKNVIYFRGLRDVFSVNDAGRRIGYWHNEDRFGEITVIHDQLWLQWRGEGLRRLSGDTFIPIAGTQSFSKSLIYNMFPLQKGGVLITDVAPSISIFKDGQTTVLNDADLVSQNEHLVNGVALANGKFAFGGDDGVLRILDLDARRFDTIPIGNSFIPEVKIDADGSLLSVDDMGMIRVNWPLRWLRYGDADGFKGSVYSIEKIADRIILSTGSGVYETLLPHQTLTSPFRGLNGTGNEAWQVLQTDHGMLLAESRALHLMNGDKIDVVSRDDLYPRVMLRDPNRKGHIWIGTEFGPVLIKESGNSFIEVSRPSNEPWLVSSLAVTPSGVLLGSEEAGLAIAIPDASNDQQFRVEHFSNKQGIQFGQKNTAIVSTIPEGIIVSTEAGLFRFTENRFVRDDLGGLDKLLADDETVFFKTVNGGGLWAISYHSAYLREKTGKWNVALRASPSDGPFLTLLALPDGGALIGSSGHVLHYIHREGGSAQSKATLRVTAVRLTHDGSKTELLALDSPSRILMKGSNLEFDLALTDFAEGNGKEYQFRLEGFDGNWSEWSQLPSIRFFALPPAKYTLHIRARYGYSNVIEGAPYTFEVVPRWFERPWVIPSALFSACFLIAAGLIKRQRNRVKNLRLKNVELDKLVHERTRNLEIANLSLQDLADRDGLTGIANRRKFDVFLEKSVNHAQQNSLALGLAMVDVDFFKLYNDTHGHQAGDDVLKGVAKCLSESVRGDTLVARYGGEEFAIVAPACTNDVMHALAARICKHVEEALGGITVSIGVSALGSVAKDSAELLVARADAALYEAKNGGRNRVV